MRNFLLVIIFIVCVCFGLFLSFKLSRTKNFPIAVLSHDSHVIVQSVSYRLVTPFLKESLSNTQVKRVSVQFVSEKQTGFQRNSSGSNDYFASSDWEIEGDALVIKINLNVEECKKFNHQNLQGLIFQHVFYQVLSYKKSSELNTKSKSFVEIDQFILISQKFIKAKLFLDVSLL